MKRTHPGTPRTGGRSPLRRYGLAVVAVAVAMGVRLAAGQFLDVRALMALLFYPAIVTAAWLGGVGPGLLATALSVVAISPLTPRPYGMSGVEPAVQCLRMVLLVFVGSQVSWLLDSLGRQRERAAESERILDALMEYVPEGILVIEGPDGRVRRISRYGAEVAGLTPAAVEGRCIGEIEQVLSARRPGEAAPPPVTEMPLFRAVHGGEVIADEEWILASADDRDVPVLCAARPVRDQRGGVVGGILTWHDISERKRAQSEREQLLTILESSPDIIARATAEGQIVYLNRAGRRFVGLPEGAELQAHMGDHRPEWAARKILEECVPAAMRDGVWRGETALLRHDGTEVPVSQVTVAHRDAAGQVAYFSTIMRDISAAKDAERERERLLMETAAQHDLLHSVVRNAPVGIAIVAGPEHRFILANPAYEAMAHGRGEIVGRTVAEVWPEVASVVLPLLDRVRETGEPFHAVDAPFAAMHDGRPVTFHYDFTYAPLRDEAGDVERILVVIEDTTAQVAAREHIQELVARAEAQRTRIEAVIAQMPAGVVILDAPSGKLLICNDQVARIWRHTESVANDARRLSLLKGFHPDGRPYAPDEWPLARAVRTGETVIGEETEVERGDGTRAILRANAAPVRDAEGHVVAGVVVFQDVTESKKMEQSLQEGEARLRIALNAAGMASWHYDFRTGEVICSEKGQQLLGLGAEHPMSLRVFLGAVHPEDRGYVNRELARMRSGTLHNSVECRVVWPDRSVHWLSLHGRTHLEQGRPARVEGVAADITEFKLADQRKDEFLAMLAHELRNPLAAIASGLHLVEMRVGPESRAQSTLATTTEEVRHMARLVDDLLDVSRVTQGKIGVVRKRLDLGSAVAAALETSRPGIEARGHTVSVSLPEQPVVVNGDYDRLKQVIGNLLDNAAKYTPPGGRIWLSMAAAGGDAVVRVRDSGIGIEADVIPHLFDLFVQGDRSSARTEGGLGIGLTMVRQLVDLHGGKVEARSEGPGRGSEFTVLIPLAGVGDAQPDADHEPAGAETAASTPGMVHKPTGPPPSHRILVVDDNVPGAEVLAEVLAEYGYQVLTAHDGRAAVDLASEWVPDVVLLDIGLPGMDGCEVAEQLRRRDHLARMVLIAVTGYGREEDRRRTAEAGFAIHLTKPVEPEELLRVLARVCGEAGAPS